MWRGTSVQGTKETDARDGRKLGARTGASDNPKYPVSVSKLNRVASQSRASTILRFLDLPIIFDPHPPQPTPVFRHARRRVAEAQGALGWPRACRPEKQGSYTFSDALGSLSVGTDQCYRAGGSGARLPRTMAAVASSPGIRASGPRATWEERPKPWLN